MHNHDSDDINWNIFLMCIGGHIKNTDSCTMKASMLIAERVFLKFKAWIVAKKSPNNVETMVIF